MRQERGVEHEAGHGTARRITAPRRWNRPMVAILRSPLHGLISRRLLVVTARGRVSGRPLAFPVGYVVDGDGWLAVVAEHEQKQWWRNVEADPAVELTVRRERVPAQARVLRPSDGAEHVEAFRRYVDGFRSSGKALGVVYAGGAPTDASVRAAAPAVLMVRFDPR
ncbi:MAG: nitroreductase family deazaflavin-dependent oxidoreductase [Planctomycetaceae bacterium]